MPKERIIIVGSSGHARVVLDVLARQGAYEVVGLIDSFKPAGTTIYGHLILGPEACLARLLEEEGVTGGIVAIGDNFTRAALSGRLFDIAPSFSFVRAIHPAAVIAPDVSIEEGTVVMAGAVINPGCQIGVGCIINTRASLDHDSVMEPFSSLAPGSTTGGNVRIGEGSSIGLGANILHGISVGKHTVIGGASLVNRNVPNNSVAFGVPAKVVRTRQAFDKYL